MHPIDAGYGCGDSLLVHLEHPNVPRPTRLVGITSQHYHYSRALDRTNLRNPGGVDVRLYKGDAVYRPSSQSHPLARNHLNTYTSILALDCAYHFDTRRAFLEQAFACLAPGGRVALADLCFVPGSLSSWTKLKVSVAGTMPWNNIITTEEYIATLRAIGYVDVDLQDISEHVFPPFTEFLKTRGYAFSTFASHLRGLASRGLLFVMVSASKPSATTKR